MQSASLPFAFPLESTQILQLRSLILVQLCTMDEGFCRVPVDSIQDETLLRILQLYDARFFGSYLAKKMPCLHVTLSARLTSSAGKFLCMRGPFGRIKSAEIRLSSDFLLRLKQGPFSLNGLSVATAQEAFLVVFEHELCHAVETLLYGQTGHSSRFLALANGLFGHTAIRHSLPTRRQEAAVQGLCIGSSVRFTKQEQTLCGVVTYIGKQVTVMVPSASGEYRDPKGRRYDKYRVPLHLLTDEKE